MDKDRFKKCVTSQEELKLLVGSPSEKAKKKVMDCLDHHCRQFIEKSPFLVMATSDENGRCDSSPRGDAPGFVHVIDDYHLVIPERPGNKRVDSLLNILSNPHIGLLFVIPGLEETLRVNGQAVITEDEQILNEMQVNGKAPILGTIVKVDECFIHCAKAFKRSKLWDSKTWLDQAERPNPAKMLHAHVNLPGLSEEKIAAELQESYRNRLY
ncbi:pyridoxamine 5'-phosphate oxidase family protein [Pseudalkalibacillus berkeleyi]|uniref:Pyridoxamine 5'-phosphate oxidase family protein n=1 Tax=Pseudalkalibacillus berkeleyi TaxID=1069813 RepID=A0ABS9H1T2_9BACL|nr:pyridoxamine 5'-phosphate oxidase family protein [Pseudalkalibacillus berkeleyi]MCF6137793.1 pyridoxamine 5'-phosphate oxidase family protein [Pseudalkalibacillus berkeleyi]